MEKREILHYLNNVKSVTNRWVTSEELASVFNVSQRTIREKIKKLNTDYEYIETKKSKGYRVKNEIQQFHIYEEKIVLEILMLLLDNKQLKASEIIEKLYISRRVLNKNLQIIEMYGIRFVKSKGYLQIIENDFNYILIANLLCKYNVITQMNNKQSFEKRYFVTLNRICSSPLIVTSIKNKCHYSPDKLEAKNLKIAIDNVFDMHSFEKLVDVEFLKQSIYEHLLRAFAKLKYQIYIENPMIDLIETKYHSGNYYANVFAKLLAEQLKMDIPREEVGYITLYFENVVRITHEFSLTVYYDGSKQDSIYYNNYYKLKTTFPKHNFVMDNAKYYDLVISDDSEADYQLVGILKNSNLEQIAQLLQYKTLLKYNQKNLYFEVTDEQDKYELLSKVAKQCNIKSQVIASIINRERDSTTELNSHVAIPHPLQHATDGNSEFIVIKLNKAFKWDEFEVDYIVIFLLNFKLSRNNVVLLKFIYEVFASEQKYREFIKYLERNNYVNK